MKMLRLILLFTFFLGTFSFFQCNCDFNYIVSYSNGLDQLDKQKGAHLFGDIDLINLQPFKDNNYNWMTFVVFGDQKDHDSPTMRFYRGDSLEMLRRDSVWKSEIGIAHAAGFKVFLKPHVWIYEPFQNIWRSDIFPNNEENWVLWKNSYREFILYSARLAERIRSSYIVLALNFQDWQWKSQYFGED